MILQGRTAIVSGVGPGLGRAIGIALAEAGASVALAARDAERIEEIRGEIEQAGGRAIAVSTDVTDPDQCQSLVDRTLEEFGAVHTLVNSAFRQPPFNRLEDADEQEYREAFEVNFFGSAWLTKAALPALRASAPSSIVFINTMSVRRIREHFGLYTSAKMALLGMAQALAVEHGQDRIRVNSVHPGYIWGPSVKWFIGNRAENEGRTFDDVYEEIASETLLHHLPGADEIAQSVVFLASEKMSGSITGESIDVNAGQTIR